ACLACGEGSDLRVRCEPQLTTRPLGASAEQPPVSLSHPRSRGRGNGNDQSLFTVDRDQLSRSDPDLEGALAGRPREQLADPLPLRAVLDGRTAEASSNLVEVDADRASAPATTFADECLLDEDRLGRGPPFRGARGVFPDSGIQGLLSRARV